MLTLQTKLRVDGISGREIFDFLAEPDDQSYQEWWPGTHLHLHLLERHEGHVGDVIYMDEYVGKRRVRMVGVVREAVPGKRLVWQFKKVVRLPAQLTLDLADDDGGVAITHTIEAGLKGAGRVLDPLLRLYFSRSFAAAMDDHARTEFPLLRAKLKGGPAPGPVSAPAGDIPPRGT